LKVVLPTITPLLKWKVGSLNGFVTRLFLESNGKTVQTSIKIAELLVTIRLHRELVDLLKLCPGKEVRIQYEPREIEWL